MTNSKINIQVVEKVDDNNKKLASFEWQFLNSTLGVADLTQVKEMGIETYTELECIDERAAAQTILTGRIRIELNFPGGGFDYLKENEIQNILKQAKGLVVLDPHRSCGWGKIRQNYYVNLKQELKVNGAIYKDGLEYIKFLVKNAFLSNNFLNSVLRSSKLQKYYNFRSDFDNAFNIAFAKPGKLTIKDEVHGELIDLAFAYSKLEELKTLFENEAEKIGMTSKDIRLNPDMLFDQPGYHVAAGAVLNLTQRKLVKRFSFENVYEEAFFADLDIDRVTSVFDLIVSILEGDHSATKGTEHDVFVVCNKSQLTKVKETFEKYRKHETEFKTKKNIYIHVVENDERSKSREQLLSLIR
jgi:hypothetical protein